MSTYHFLSPYEEQTQKAAVIALVFGILSLPFSRILGIGIPFGIVAIVQGNKALRLAEREKLLPDTKAKVGRILGVFGIIASVIALVRGVFKIVAVVSGLIASIESGSVGGLFDFFHQLGHSLHLF